MGAIQHSSVQHNWPPERLQMQFHWQTWEADSREGVGNSWRWGVEQQETFDTNGNLAAAWLRSPSFTLQREAQWPSVSGDHQPSPAGSLLHLPFLSRPQNTSRYRTAGHSGSTASDRWQTRSERQWERLTELPPAAPGHTGLSGNSGTEEQFGICFVPEQLQGAFQGTLSWLKAWVNQNGKAWLGWLEAAALPRVWQGRAHKCISIITRNVLPFLCCASSVHLPRALHPSSALETPSHLLQGPGNHLTKPLRNSSLPLIFLPLFSLIAHCQPRFWGMPELRTLGAPGSCTHRQF